MAAPAYRNKIYLCRSIQERVGDSLLTPAGVTVPVYHHNITADPDNIRQGAAGGDRCWVETQWITLGAGRRSSSLWQVDVYQRVGDEGTADYDPYGLTLSEAEWEIAANFTGVDGEGGLRAYIPILDYSSDPAVPTGHFLICVAARGEFGEPDSGPQAAPAADGLLRQTARWRFVTTQDGIADPSAFYT